MCGLRKVSLIDRVWGQAKEPQGHSQQIAPAPRKAIYNSSKILDSLKECFLLKENLSDLICCLGTPSPGQDEGGEEGGDYRRVQWVRVRLNMQFGFQDRLQMCQHISILGRPTSHLLLPGEQGVEHSCPLCHEEHLDGSVPCVSTESCPHLDLEDSLCWDFAASAAAAL